MTLNDYYKGYDEEMEEEIKDFQVNKNEKLRKYIKFKEGFLVAFNNFTMSDAEL